jgi:hypothetical protein
VVTQYRPSTLTPEALFCNEVDKLHARTCSLVMQIKVSYQGKKKVVIKTEFLNLLQDF